jgi:type II secretory pathway component PulC
VNEKRRKKIVYLILVVAVIWGVYNFPAKRGEKADIETPATVQPLSSTLPAQSVGKMINIEQKSLAAWGADPFRAKKSFRPPPRKPPVWRLSGIVYNSQTPLAIINNRPVQAGDMVNNARVLSIKAKTVTLEHNGALLTLTVTKG